MLDRRAMLFYSDAENFAITVNNYHDYDFTCTTVTSLLLLVAFLIL